MSRQTVMMAVFNERERQEKLWGVQNRPSFPYAQHVKTRIAKLGFYIDEQEAKDNCTNADKAGRLTFAHILTEEVLEALSCTNLVTLREELIQVAAVAVQWAESIDRNQI